MRRSEACDEPKSRPSLLRVVMGLPPLSHSRRRRLDVLPAGRPTALKRRRLRGQSDFSPSTLATDRMGLGHRSQGYCSRKRRRRLTGEEEEEAAAERPAPGAASHEESKKAGWIESRQAGVLAHSLARSLARLGLLALTHFSLLESSSSPSSLQQQPLAELRRDRGRLRERAARDTRRRGTESHVLRPRLLGRDDDNEGSG